MTSEEYWADREAQKQAKVDEITDKDVELVRKAIDESIEGLKQSIRDIYRKYAYDNDMDYYTAVQYLTDDERAEFQRDLKYYVEKYHDSEYVKRYKKELHSLSVRARVKRIDTVIAEIKKYASELEEHLNKDTRAIYDDIYMEGYLRANYETLEAGEPSINFANAFPYEKVQEILDTPWSGKNYSRKVWDTTGAFAETLESVLTRGLIQGQHPDVIAREFRKAGFGKEEKNKDGSIRKGGIARRAEDLIRTEAANVIEQAALNAYSELNVEEYRYKVSIDGKQCAVCEDLNNRYFPANEAKTGFNYPPMHTNCRCTTKPKSDYDDEDESQYDLSYDEWYAKFVQPEVDAIHRKRLKPGSENGKIDVEIDEFTECLRDTKKDILVDTTVSKVSFEEIKDLTKGWNFDWSKVSSKSNLYALKVKGIEDIQGLLAITELANEHTMYIDLVESNPTNVGEKGRYKGVGGHLFAEACKQAKDHGYDYVYFDAKTKLVEHYRKALGAINITNQRMVIDGEAFNALIKKYYKEG